MLYRALCTLFVHGTNPVELFQAVVDQKKPPFRAKERVLAKEFPRFDHFREAVTRNVGAFAEDVVMMHLLQLARISKKSNAEGGVIRPHHEVH